MLKEKIQQLFGMQASRSMQQIGRWDFNHDTPPKPRFWKTEAQQIEEWMEEDRMSRGREVPLPLEPQEGFEITEAMTNLGRKITFKNGTASKDGMMIQLDDGERIVSVSERRKVDPAIYNPENLATELREGRDDKMSTIKEKIELLERLECGDIDKNQFMDRYEKLMHKHGYTEIHRTAKEWRQEKLVKQDQYGEVFDIKRYNYLRTEPDALMTKEEWELVFNTIKFEEQEGAKIEVRGSYADVIVELSDTYTKKNADYGNSFEKTLDKRGLTPAVVRMEEKMERMEKLWEAEAGLVDDESIIDSAMDLANYAIMTAMWLKKKNGKTNGEERLFDK